ncbi:tetratricopeptide repeat protein [Mangrovibrevibacter kandeliae]|uniref:tetratricopeptide repeat protein n=1 Tax=Mangrovibrevibacter kandeliae TaxID=2968473 RepID=UPI002118C1DC|nr:sel1 repeat family protein [Aurantimonas sp. CSK15Z-1]
MRGARAALLAATLLAVAPASAEPAKPALAPTGHRDHAGSAGPKASPSNMAYGAFQRGLYVTARKLAEPLANLGDPAAQTLLGEIYSRGFGVTRDPKTAAHWYEAAAASGSAEGEFRYALMLLDGKVVTQDLARARDLMKAAADAGNPLAEFNYGQMLIQASPSGGFTEARGYFEKAATAGVSDAQYAMSQLLAYAPGGGHPDLPAARAWLLAAAINGHDTAQIEIGIWLINGKGGPADARQGFFWLRRAANRGNPIALNRVAHLYKDGIGTPPDTVEAAKWAVLAKRADNSDPVLDDFFRGLDQGAQKSALEAANRFRSVRSGSRS